MKRLLMSIIVLTLTFSAQAADNVVQVIPSLPRVCSSTPFGETCLHTFGGEPTRIPLPVEQERSCAGVKAQLYQLSTRLAAPVDKPVSLSGKDCGSVVMYLPEVREKTVFRVSLLKPGADGKTVSSDTVMAALVQVYPNDLWEPLRDWSLANSLILNDRDNRLTPLLDQQHIAYSLMMLSSNDEHKKQVCIWVPGQSAATEDEPPYDCDSLLVLHEMTESLSYILVRDTQGQRRTDVYMPLINALNKNPLVQSTFINLIQSQL